MNSMRYIIVDKNKKHKFLKAIHIIIIVIMIVGVCGFVDYYTSMSINTLTNPLNHFLNIQ